MQYVIAMSGEIGGPQPRFSHELLLRNPNGIECSGPYYNRLWAGRGQSTQQRLKFPSYFNKNVSFITSFAKEKCNDQTFFLFSSVMQISFLLSRESTGMPRKLCYDRQGELAMHFSVCDKNLSNWAF